MKLVEQILREIFPSEEMANYLVRCPFGDDIKSAPDRHFVFDDAPPEKLPIFRHDLADAIGGAPIPLERKRELFLLLAKDDKDGFFANRVEWLNKAIQEMRPKPGEFFLLRVYQYDDTYYRYHREIDVDPFLTWEQIQERMEDYLDADEDCDNLIWFDVEKWRPDGNGKLENIYDFYVLGREVCYADCHDRSIPAGIGFGIYQDVRLPIPFHAGDIVTVDCRPVEPVSRVVILEIRDNYDCSSVSALYRSGDGTWNAGAVKHGCVFPSGSAVFSPLFRMASYHGQLPEEDRLLETVSQYINGDEARGEALWDFITPFDEITEAQILAYIAEKGDTPT